MTVIQLDYPLTYEGKTYQELTLRRSNAGDMERLEMRQGGEATKSIQLMSDLCELPPDAIRALDMVDYIKLNEAVTDFLSKTRSQPIGLPS